MQPYQRASEEIKRQGENPGKVLKTAASIGASAGSLYAGGSVMSRVLPFLSQYIPEDLAKKGLSKIDPRFGKFIDTAEENGTPFDEVKEFIQGKADEALSEEHPKEDRNILQQYDPYLHDYIQGLIKNGSTPTEAAVKAKKFLDKSKKDLINKIEKDHKTPFTNIVESIFGGGQSNVNPDLQEGQQQPQQMGQGQQALMGILQRINQRLGK